MALTVSAPIISEALGKERWVEVIVAGDASYPNGTGYPITPAMFGFNAFANQPLQGSPTVPTWEVVVENLTSPAWYAYGDFSSGNLKLAVNTTGVEVANTINVSTFKAVLGALGH